MARQPSASALVSPLTLRQPARQCAGMPVRWNNLSLKPRKYPVVVEGLPVETPQAAMLLMAFPLELPVKQP